MPVTSVGEENLLADEGEDEGEDAPSPREDEARGEGDATSEGDARGEGDGRGEGEGETGSKEKAEAAAMEVDAMDMSAAQPCEPDEAAEGHGGGESFGEGEGDDGVV